MPAGIICLDCGRIHVPQPGETTRGRCPSCRDLHSRRPRQPHRQTARRATGQALYASAAWRRVRDLVRERDGSCRRCGSTTNLTAHHLTSIHERPDLSLDPANVITLCRSCHGTISNRERARPKGGGSRSA